MEVVVALALLGIALVAIIQLFSISLRTTRKSTNYTTALIHARSLMQEAYSLPRTEDIPATVEFEDGFSAVRELGAARPVGAGTEQGGQDGPSVNVYEITVTVNWPPRGSLKLTGTRVIMESTNEE